MRYRHIIKPTHGDKLPTQCVSISVGKPDKNGERLAAICTARIRPDKEMVIQTDSGTCQYVRTQLAAMCRANSCTWLIAPYLYQTLVELGWFDSFNEGTWSISGKDKHRGGAIVHEQGCCYIIAWRKDGGRLICVDPENYGVEGLPYVTDSPVTNASVCMSWWLSWLDWLRDCRAGTAKVTLASQSAYTFRRRFMKHEIECHDDLPALALEEKCLYGGRCEAFRLGKLPGEIFHLDANSLYGAVAAKGMIPTHLISHISAKDDDEDITDLALVSINEIINGLGRLKSHNNGYDIAADVTVTVSEPIVPIRVKDCELTVWPIGTFRTQLAGPELVIVKDKVIKIHAMSLYRTQPIFKEWAAWCWERRQFEIASGNKILSKQLKKWAQFFYGRFAQRHRGWSLDPNQTDGERWELWWQRDPKGGRPIAHRRVEGRCEVYADKGLSPQAVPSITAWINSLARVWLHKAIATAGRENTFYVDTDSLFVNVDGMERLFRGGYIIGDNLGDLRIVGRHKQVVIHGWKHYTCDNNVTCAGDALRRRFGLIDSIPGESAHPLTVAAANRNSPGIGQTVRSKVGSMEYRLGRVLPDGRIDPWTF